MPIDHAESWADFGLAGLVIAALFGLVWMLISAHRSERSEWIAAYKEQTAQMIEAQKESNEVIRSLTAVVERSTNRRRGSDMDFEQHR